MELDTEFNFIKYLEADLDRLYLLKKHTGILKKKGFLYWIGILSPRFLPILFLRMTYYLYLSRVKFLAKIPSSANLFFFGLEAAIPCHIGPGLFLPHPLGVIIGASKIGKNATIYQGATLGSKKLDMVFNKDLRPVLGDGVTIGAGAKVLGGINVADDTTIGANAVLLSSTLAGSTYVGIPAKNINT